MLVVEYTVQQSGIEEWDKGPGLQNKHKVSGSLKTARRSSNCASREKTMPVFA